MLSFCKYWSCAHRSDSSLHFDTGNMYQIRIKNQNSSSWRLLPSTMLERLPHVCRVNIMFTLLPTYLFRFSGHKDEFDEMPCKLDSTENPRTFDIPNPTLWWAAQNPLELVTFVASKFLKRKIESWIKRSEIRTTNELRCQVEGTIQLVPEPQKMAIIISRVNL